MVTITTSGPTWSDPSTEIESVTKISRYLLEYYYVIQNNDVFKSEHINFNIYSLSNKFFMKTTRIKNNIDGINFIVFPCKNAEITTVNIILCSDIPFYGELSINELHLWEGTLRTILRDHLGLLKK